MGFTLADGKGFGVFSAGAASDGGGEACLNRVTDGGKQGNVCLGSNCQACATRDFNL